MHESRKQLLLAPDRVLFTGDLPPTGWHRHGAPVLLMGLSGDIDVCFRNGTRERCRSAVVDAGVDHCLDTRGERVATFYLEPDVELVPWLRVTLLADGPAAFDVAVPSRVKRYTEGRLHSLDPCRLLRHAPRAGSAPELDPRIAATLRLLRQPHPGVIARGELASVAGLSESRFNHLFSEQAGISFRRYRSWAMVRSSLGMVARQSSLTDAALHAGLYDSAHFSRLFRDLIGLTPSSVLKDLTIVRTA